MPDRVLDLRLFRYALASAEHGSFRRAAAALNVEQSTVSRGVRNLEDRLGAELFERGHAGIRPTPTGDRFLEEVSLGFDRLTRALQLVGALQRGEYGELTIGVSVPVALLRELLSQFRKEYNGVSVEIVEGTSRVSWTLVQQRTVDIAFVAKIYGNGALRSLHLRDGRMAAVLPKSHPFAGASRVNLEELRLEQFIFGASGLGPDIENHLSRRMAKLGIEPRMQLHRVGQCNLINMVALGFGVTIAVGAPPRAAPDGVVLIPLAGRNVISISAVWMDSNPNPALKALLSIVRASADPGDAMH